MLEDELLLEELELLDVLELLLEDELELLLLELLELRSSQSPPLIPSPCNVIQSILAKPAESSASNIIVFSPAARSKLIEVMPQLVQVPVDGKSTLPWFTPFT